MFTNIDTPVEEEERRRGIDVGSSLVPPFRSMSILQEVATTSRGNENGECNVDFKGHIH